MESNPLLLPSADEAADLIRRWQSLDASLAASLRAGIPPAPALARLGIRLCTQNRLPESLEVLRAATALAPIDPLLWTNLAVVLDRSGLTTDAITAGERALHLSHHQPDTWLLLGNMKKQQADLSGAQAAYETAVSLQPNFALAWQLLAILQQQQHQYHAALDSIIHCVKNGDTSAPTLSILAQLFYQTGQFEKSRDAYTAALQADPQSQIYQQMHRETQFVCDALGTHSIDAVIDAYRRTVPDNPAQPDTDLRDLLQKTYSLLSGYGHTRAAQRIGEKLLQLSPASPTAGYLLQALKSDPAVTRSPDAYLVEYFDKFAEKFDHHLINTLGYAVPEKLCAALYPFLPTDQHLAILDAGCGTGLCGPHLRRFAQSLIGVDLSNKMLDQARQRNIYDQLICQELTSYLENSPAAFDVIVAADVLIYFGDLAPLIAALMRSLRPHGLLAFSIETTLSSHYQLLPSGRFAQNRAYVRNLLAPNFIECFAHDTPIRIEASHPTPGTLFIFRRGAN
jgi:predicted TPR repeat methyltransferase